MADSAVMNINEASMNKECLILLLWDRFGVLTCVPWFNALVLQVSGLYIEYNMMCVVWRELD